MKETLRFSHIAADFSANNILIDFNLVMFESEITTLIGSNSSGKHCLKELLLNRIQLKQGNIFLFGDHTDPAAISQRLKAGEISYIDQISQLVPQLTVADNLFLLKQSGRSRFLYNEKAAVYETDQLMKEYGIPCSALDRASGLSPSQQYLIALVKAVIRRSKIIILDFSSIFFTREEQRQIAEILLSRKDKGASFLLIQSVPDALTDVSDKTVFLEKGYDSKIFFGKDGALSSLSHYFQKNSSSLSDPAFRHGDTIMSGKKEDTLLFEYSAGDIIGFYDYLYTSRSTSGSFLKDFLEKNRIQIFFNNTSETYCIYDYLYIPENSELYLHPSLDVAENLILPHYHKICSMLGMCPRYYYAYFSKRFFSEVNIEPTERLEDLPILYRRILSVYRWGMLHPRIFFIDNPSTGLDFHEEKIFFQFLKKISMDGNIIFILSNRQELLQKYCTTIIRSQDLVLDSITAS